MYRPKPSRADARRADPGRGMEGAAPHRDERERWTMPDAFHVPDADVRCSSARAVLDPEMARRRTRAHPVTACQTHLAIQLHSLNPPAPVSGKGRKTGRVLLRHSGLIPAATVCGQ